MIREFATLISRVCPVEFIDIAKMIELSQSYPQISPRDLIHVATATRNNVDVILSVDQDFDRIKEVKRVDPRDFGSVL